MRLGYIPNIFNRETFENSTGGDVVAVSAGGRLRLLPVASMAAMPWVRIDDAEGVPKVSRRLVALSAPLSDRGREVVEMCDSEGRCESPRVGFISSNHPAMMHRKVISCRLESGVRRLASGKRDCGVERVKVRPEPGIPCCGNEVVVFVAAQ